MVTTNHHRRKHQNMLNRYTQLQQKCGDFGVWHCVKRVQIRSYFWSVFSCIRIEYGDLRSKSPYSIRIQENTDQK